MRRCVLSCVAAAILGGASGAAAMDQTSAARSVGPVPPGTSATSVTFVSANEAFVLGTAPCAHRPCSVILRTLDRGHTWVGLPAPRQGISTPRGLGLWGLRFADPRRGYAYGRGIWRTLNGAASWQRWSIPGRYVIDFAAVRDRELVAVTASCAFGSAHCANRLALYHRPIAGGRWRLAAVSGRQAFNESISVHRGVVWVLIGQLMLVSGDGGRTFSPHSQPCAASPDGLPQPTSVADGGANTYLLCTGQGALGHTVKILYVTRGLRSGWRRVGRAPFAGDAGQLAATGRTLVIATASAASWLYRSTDGGRHWRTPLSYPDGGIGWGELGFTNASDGVVIHGPADRDGGSAMLPGRLLLTSNAGRTWAVIPF